MSNTPHPLLHQPEGQQLEFKRDLLEQNLIAMTLPDKPQSRPHRYRLTAQGRALLAAPRSHKRPTP